MGLVIFPKRFYDTWDVQNALLASMASHVGTEGIKISSWEDLQRLTRMGLAEKMFVPGDQLLSSYGEEGQILWDVIGINHDIPTDKRFPYSITIQPHDCILNAQISAAQALYYATTELAAGEHVFTLHAKQYEFTTGEAVPEGGQVFITNWQSSEGEGVYVPTKITTYAANRTSVVESGLNVTPIESGADTLTPVNHHQRCRYGSNNYVESAIRQWLNSGADAFVWTSKTNFDRPSTGAPYTGAGFLKLLDPDLVAVLGAVDKQVIRNTVTDEGGQDLFSDKVFLLSRVEVYGGTEGTTTGEKAYPYYSALAVSPTTDPLAGRIKYLDAAARHWWLRSPDPGYAHVPRYVCTSGTVSNDYAVDAIGAAPACCIV